MKIQIGINRWWKMMKYDENNERYRLGCRMLFLTMPFLWCFLSKSSVAGTDSSVGWSLRADGAGQTKASPLWFGLELRCFCGSMSWFNQSTRWWSREAFKSLWIYSFPASLKMISKCCKKLFPMKQLHTTPMSNNPHIAKVKKMKDRTILLATQNLSLLSL